jgi:hypothetical protein
MGCRVWVAAHGACSCPEPSANFGAANRQLRRHCFNCAVMATRLFSGPLSGELHSDDFASARVSGSIPDAHAVEDHQ